jgi:glyoxylase-like metal-dependent hydrolase (beta-lactamase superfamily II)
MCQVNSNTVIILLGDGVLVLDANSTPSAARSLIEQIKKLTSKPVKYVVNTHFHADHTQGNEAYPNALPAGVEIISSEATRANLEQRGIPRWKHEFVAMPQEIEPLKSDLQKALSAEQKESNPKETRRSQSLFCRT